MVRKKRRHILAKVDILSLINFEPFVGIRNPNPRPHTKARQEERRRRTPLVG